MELLEPTLGQTLLDLFGNLTTLGYLLGRYALHYLLWILWVVWWVRAVNWRHVWPVLSVGGWAPVLLVMVLVALVWSRLDEGPCPCGLPNFWWQLAYVGLFGVAALVCGWVQGIVNLAPPEISFDPPAVHDEHDHAHSHDHSHSHEHGHSHGHSHSH